LRRVLIRPLLLVVPEVGVARDMVALGMLAKRDYDLRGRLFPAHRLHVTMHHFGEHADPPEDIVARVKEAASAVCAERFEVAFDFMEMWSDALVLRGTGMAALNELHRKLGVALRKVGLGEWVKAGFTPHVTLMRDRGYVETQMVMTFRWTVREFVLVNSLVGRTTYVPLGAWRLH
jgi:RNA 2',3'-cyclic 3'-phosphodiesterase